MRPQRWSAGSSRPGGLSSHPPRTSSVTEYRECRRLDVWAYFGMWLAVLIHEMLHGLPWILLFGFGLNKGGIPLAFPLVGGVWLPWQAYRSFYAATLGGGSFEMFATTYPWWLWLVSAAAPYPLHLLCHMAFRYSDRGGGFFSGLITIMALDHPKMALLDAAFIAIGVVSALGALLGYLL